MALFLKRKLEDERFKSHMWATATKELVRQLRNDWFWDDKSLLAVMQREVNYILFVKGQRHVFECTFVAQRGFDPTELILERLGSLSDQINISEGQQVSFSIEVWHGLYEDDYLVEYRPVVILTPKE